MISPIRTLFVLSSLATAIATTQASNLYQSAILKSGSPSNYDNFGWAVDISGDTIVVAVKDEKSSSTGINSVADELAFGSGAVYVFARSGSGWEQQAYIKADNTGEGDHFGESVAIDGDTLVVGAPDEDGDTGQSGNNSGSVYVFKRTGTTWTQQAYLRAGNADVGHRFGFSVDIDGDTIIAGAPYENRSAKGVNNPDLGTFMAQAGAAYTFVRDGETWTQQAYIKSSITNFAQFLGYSVALSGNTAVVGAWGESTGTSGIDPVPDNQANASGAIFVFERDGTTWSQQAFIKADPVGGGDRLGDPVAISGDTIVAGAFDEDSNTTGVNSTPNEDAENAGAAYVFVRNDSTWSQQAYLKARETSPGDIFGRYLAIDGDLIAIGSYHEDSSTTGINTTPNEDEFQAGAVYTFVRSENTWTEQDYIKPNQIGLVHEFGNAVVIDEGTIVAAAHFAFEPGGINGSFARFGAVYVFSEINGLAGWRQVNFGSADNTGTGANDADFDRDGHRNLIEYGVVTDPTRSGDPAISIQPQTYSGQEFLQCIFTRDPSRDDVNLSVEASNSPAGPWTILATSANGAIPTGPGFIAETDLSGGLKRVEVRDTVPVATTDSPPRFIRIRAE